MPQNADRRGSASAWASDRFRWPRISSRRAGVTRSSASRLRIQSPVAASTARFFCGPKPGQSSVWMAVAPAARAIATVSSVLAQSTIIASSHQDTLSRHGPIL
ncbi:hypothetical protein D3C86_1934400 [compost metagenome]